MKALTAEERRRYGALLKDKPQAEVMAMIPQFAEAEIHSGKEAPQAAGRFGALVFNMERGANLAETVDFLRYCPGIRPCDLILANELDDGANRTGNRDTAKEIAEQLGMNYVFGLEFIELIDPTDPKGFHGNAVFSRWPIVWAEVLRLPEAYNWYFDRQIRIGGRNAVFAKLDVGGRPLGVVSIHLENRTGGAGRAMQMEAILKEADRVFPGIPVILGGDLNTNTFDGCDKAAINVLAAEPAEQRRRICNTADFEPLLNAAEAAGFPWRDANCLSQETRRKPLPDGSELPMHLDWVLARGLTPVTAHTLSTLTRDCTFAPAGSALSRFAGTQLSDHNAVWTEFRLEPQK